MKKRRIKRRRRDDEALVGAFHSEGYDKYDHCKVAGMGPGFYMRDEQGELQCRGVNEQIHFRIQIRNLDEDVIQMLTIQIRILFAAELGNHIQEVCAIALWKRTHCHLVDGGLRF